MAKMGFFCKKKQWLKMAKSSQNCLFWERLTIQARLIAHFKNRHFPISISYIFRLKSTEMAKISLFCKNG